MASFVVAMTVLANLTTVAAASRQLWAFSRDNAVPFSSWFSREFTSLTHIVVSWPDSLFRRNSSGAQAPTQRHYHIASCYKPSLTHQHRLSCGAQLPHLSHDRGTPFQLHVLHRLYDLAPHHQPAAATFQVHSRQVGSRCQYCFGDLSRYHFHLFILSNNTISGSCGYELEYPHLWSCNCGIFDILCTTCQTPICRTGRVCEKAGLMAAAGQLSDIHVNHQVRCHLRICTGGCSDSSTLAIILPLLHFIPS